MEEAKRKKAEYRSSIRSKSMIKDALLSLMIEKPFEKISITDIVRRADINRGTFYAHYSNTDEVLKGISTGVVDELASIFADSDTSQVLLAPEEFLNPITAFLKENPEYYAKLLQADRFHEVLDDARHAAIRKVLFDIPADLSDEMKTMIMVLLDYAISGIMTVYEDILLEKIPVKLEDSVQYISRILKPQREALRVMLQQMQK